MLDYFGLFSQVGQILGITEAGSWVLHSTTPLDAEDKTQGGALKDPSSVAKPRWFDSDPPFSA